MDLFWYSNSPESIIFKYKIKLLAISTVGWVTTNKQFLRDHPIYSLLNIREEYFEKYLFSVLYEAL